MRAHRLGGPEPAGIVDRRDIGQRDDRRRRPASTSAAAPAGPRAPAMRTRFSSLLQLLASAARAAQQRLGHRQQRRMTRDQFADPALEGPRRRLARPSARSRAACRAGSSPCRGACVCTSLRAVSSARVSCAGSDLQCTGRNQPSRISCAMPRASLRSVFTGIALKASRTCRVSSSSTASPASRIPAYSHCDSGPASRPIRAMLDAQAARTSRSAPPARWRSWLRARSAPSHPQRTRSSFPATRRSRHSAPWSSLDDAWSRPTPDSG